MSFTTKLQIAFFLFLAAAFLGGGISMFLGAFAWFFGIVAFLCGIQLLIPKEMAEKATNLKESRLASTIYKDYSQKQLNMELTKLRQGIPVHFVIMTLYCLLFWFMAGAVPDISGWDLLKERFLS